MISDMRNSSRALGSRRSMVFFFAANLLILLPMNTKKVSLPPKLYITGTHCTVSGHMSLKTIKEAKKLTCDHFLLVVGVTTSLLVEIDTVSDEERAEQPHDAQGHKLTTHFSYIALM